MNNIEAGRQNFKGELLTVENDKAVVAVDGEHYELNVADMENASLVKFDKRA